MEAFRNKDIQPPLFIKNVFVNMFKHVRSKALRAVVCRKNCRNAIYPVTWNQGTGFRML